MKYRIRIIALCVGITFALEQVSPIVQAYTQSAVKSPVQVQCLAPYTRMIPTEEWSIDVATDSEESLSGVLSTIHGVSSKPIQIGEDSVLPLHASYEVNGAVLQAIERAKTSIYLIMYKLDNDAVWDMLIKKTKQGVDVKVAIGVSLENDPVRRKYLERIQKRSPRLQIRYFSPRLGAADYYALDLSPEDHRKVVIADNEIAYIGDQNLQDAQLVNRTAGVLMHSSNGFPDLQQMFWNTWYEYGGEETAFYGEAKESPYYTILTNKSITHNIRYQIIKNIFDAQKRIYINQWVFEDELIVSALVEKLKQKPDLDVKVLLRTSHKSVKKTRINRNRKIFALLKQSGVSSRWFYNEDLGQFSHSKAVVTDDTVIIGSGDFNGRAYYVNRELNIEMRDKRVAESFARIFMQDWSRGLVDIPFGLKEQFNEILSQLYSLFKKMKNKVKGFVESMKDSFSYMNTAGAYINASHKSRRIHVLENPQEPVKEKDFTFLYRGVSKYEFRRVRQNRVIDTPMLRRPRIIGQGIYSSDNPEMARNFAMKKCMNSSRDTTYVLKMKLKENVRLMLYTEKVKEEYLRWVNERFGVVSNAANVYFPLYVREKGFAGYYFHEYAEAYTAVLFDYADITLVGAEEIKRHVRKEYTRTENDSAQRPVWGRQTMRYLRKVLIIIPSASFFLRTYREARSMLDEYFSILDREGKEEYHKKTRMQKVKSAFDTIWHSPVRFGQIRFLCIFTFCYVAGFFVNLFVHIRDYMRWLGFKVRGETIHVEERSGPEFVITEQDVGLRNMDVGHVSVEKNDVKIEKRLHVTTVSDEGTHVVFDRSMRRNELTTWLSVNQRWWYVSDTSEKSFYQSA